MNKTAIILGATGLTGGIVLKKLILDTRYSSIKLFSRSRIEDLPTAAEEKVTQYIGDLLDLEQFSIDFTADDVYCCIGTTLKKTPDKKLYKKIDYGIPVAAAQLAKTNNIPTFIVISAMGANTDSKVFYNRTKGEMERDLLKQHLNKTYILRPSLIEGDRDEQRTLEKIGVVVMKIIQFLFIGSLKKYKIIKAKTIAQAMINLANTTTQTDVIITSERIQSIGTTN